MSLGLLWDYVWVWWYVRLYISVRCIVFDPRCIACRRYEKMYRSIELAEWWMDTGARLVLAKAWVRGLFTQGGLQGAHKAAAGLA